MLNGIVARAGGNINRIRDDIATWFDTGMDRVAGVYKRKTQLWGFVIAMLLAIALNVDTVKIAQTLWHQPMVIKDLPPLGLTATPQQALDAMKDLSLPFGWDDTAFHDLNLASSPAANEHWGRNWLFAVVGWLITAVATLFGAPFWFDALQKFVQLRGAGSK
jgi:hypothetical protein